jgi:protein dithiol oxidoreductase (disulfide-forming)
MKLSDLRTSRRSLLKRSVGITVGSGLIASIPAYVSAQAGPVEGKHFRRMNPAVPTDDAKKIEVIEFFWYGCPHCNALEPAVVDWAKKLPADVAFRKEHVAFPQAIKHQQLFYTVKALGVEEKLSPLIFDAIHKERKPLLQVKDMAELAAKVGIDAKRFTETYDSFSVKTRMKRSASLGDSYKIDGVPAFAVNGKYYTAPSMAGGNGQAFQVLDALIQQERKK